MATFGLFPRDGHAFTSVEVGVALAGLIRRDGNGLPVPGVLGRPKIVAVASAWRVLVNPFTFVKVTGSQIQLSGVSAAEEVDIATAASTPIPSGQARIDLVVWDPSGAVLSVVQGAPAVSPVKPATGGLVELATVRVNFGDSSVNAGRVVATFVETSVQGAESAVLMGTISKRSVAAASVQNVEITFPPGLFKGLPNVQVTKNGDARDCTVAADNISATKAIVRLESNSGRTRTVGAQWRASE